MPQLHDVRQSGVRYRVNHEGQVVRLAVSAPRGAELSPRQPHAAREVVSAALLALKAKRVDDGMCAAVALAREPGAEVAFIVQAHAEMLEAKLSTWSAEETKLARRLGLGASGEVELPATLVRAIRSRAIDLAPSGSASWYDLQVWALEPLAAPERATEATRLELDASYVTHLEGLVHMILSGTSAPRPGEADAPAGHESGSAHGGALALAPRLTVEPLVTHYQRRADSYRFVRAVLAETFGEAALGEMHGLRHGVPIAQPLGMELAAMIHLYDGAAASAMRELGVATSWSARTFEQWRKAAHDPDVDDDAREMVAESAADERGLTRVRMMLGWEQAWLHTSFARPPQVEVLDARGSKGEVAPRDASYPLAMPVTVVAHVPRVLEPDEFRAVCDRYRTKEAIVAALA
jgi:hypothetical protein